MPQLVVIVGQLASMTRAEAARVIGAHGGELTERVTRATDVVILGSRGPQLQRSGRLPVQLARAQRLSQEGLPLEVWSEERWLRSVGLSDERGVRTRFTGSQIAAALQVSRPTFDRWVAEGFVRPMERNAGVPLFEFEQVAAVRTLAELFRSGVSLVKVRRALASLTRWLPTAHPPLLELSLHDAVRGLVVRTAEGCLAEPTGQLLLDFEHQEGTPSLPFDATARETDNFFFALACAEDQPQEAARIYRELIARRGPHATLAFNLGNALYAAEDLEGALAQYQHATELDPQHAGAWNNRANVLAELDRLEDALASYRQALNLHPGLADARFNLAQTLVELGRAEEAVLHWRAYLAADRDSSWADYARERLREPLETQ